MSFGGEMRLTLATVITVFAIMAAGALANGDSDVVAIWHLSEGTGYTAYDSSDNANEGVLEGDPQWTTDTPSGSGYSLDFDGAGDYVEIPDDSSQYGMSELTVETWIYPRSYPSSYYEGGIVAKWGPGWTSDDSFLLAMSAESEGTAWFAVGQDSAGHDIQVKTESAIPLNMWTKITAVYDGSTIAIYLNDVLDNSKEAESRTIYNSGMPIWIGKAHSSSEWTSYFDGMIDETKIYAAAFPPSSSDYYVHSEDGDDVSADGSLGDPWLTISHALTWILANDPGSSTAPNNIHALAGTYSSSTNGQTFPLNMQSWVSLSGEDRDTTILDAEDAAYHVIYCEGVNDFTIKGFTVRGGLGNGREAWEARGGGICCINSSPTITDNTICDNHVRYADYGYGGGVFCIDSSPLISCNVICDNTAYSSGAGIYCERSCPEVLSNEIHGNHATAPSGGGGGITCVYESHAFIASNIIEENRGEQYGGGLYITSRSAPTVHNNVISHNSSADLGGGIYCYDSSPEIRSSTITYNSAGWGGGIYRWSGSSDSPTIVNCILWANGDDISNVDCSHISYCDIENGDCSGQNGNIPDDTQLVPIYDAPYYLAHAGAQACDSPCIDAGTGTASDYGLDSMTTCTDGREDTGSIDMGYHYPAGYSGSGDTYIHLVSFTAKRHGSSVILTWETGAEIDNAGFLIYRAIAGTFDYQQIGDLIPAEGTPASGASYSFTDVNVELGVTYNYWLVDIETSGNWTAHGPATARLPMRLELIGLPSAFAQGYGGQAANAR